MVTPIFFMTVAYSKTSLVESKLDCVFSCRPNKFHDFVGCPNSPGDKEFVKEALYHPTHDCLLTLIIIFIKEL